MVHVEKLYGPPRKADCAASLFLYSDHIFLISYEKCEKKFDNPLKKALTCEYKIAIIKIIKKEGRRMEYIAHTAADPTKQDQLLKDHLLQSQVLAKRFATGTGLELTAGLIALLHDVGKYSDEFQTYIHQAKRDPKSVKRGSVDHATAGGQILLEFFKNEPLLGQLISNVVISHHNAFGVKDFYSLDDKSPFLKRIEETKNDLTTIKDRFFSEVMDETAFRKLIAETTIELHHYVDDKIVKSGNSREQLQMFFFTQKALSSILIDADRTNTVEFEEGKVAVLKERSQLFEQYHTKLLARLRDFGAPTTPINKLRNELSDQCDAFAERGDGVYTLSSPTGAGKTIASLRYALHEAVKTGKRHIIYVIPYTSIIEQNSQVFREFLNGDPKDPSNILEFHSNVTGKIEAPDKEKEAKELDHLDLAESSWDSPIIVTTMVQFQNAIFARGTRNARRFHNLLNSVLIFDEIQSIPPKTIKMFNAVINYLAILGNSDVLLCTATQPALEGVTDGIHLSPDPEVISNLAQTAEQFRRVEIIDKSTQEASLDEIVALLQKVYEQTDSALAIFNTKGAVRKVYKELQGQLPGVYHLSTSMCAAHRKQTLAEIKQRLKAGQPTLCISTQLIEAGVDISFKAIVRSLAGVDSIAQAAGRCNRNGERKLGQVYLIKPCSDVEYIGKLKEIKAGREAAKTILGQLGQHPTDLLKPKWIKRYFDEYYEKLSERLGYPHDGAFATFDLYDQLIGETKLDEAHKRGLALAANAETIARNFAVIENDTIGVLVPYQDGKTLIADFNGDQDKLRMRDLKAMFHQAQPYLINAYRENLKNLIDKGIVVPLPLLTTADTFVYAVMDERYYDPKLGLVVNPTNTLTVYDFVL